MKKDGILGVGVATMDIYVNKGRMYPGGNEFNVACNAKQLGARAGFLGVFGDDEYGPILERTLEERGIELTFSRHEHGSSGYSLVELKDDGDRIFLDWNRQGVTDLYPVEFTDEELEYVKTYQVVSCGRCSTVTAERIRRLAENGVEVCYDFFETFSDEDLKEYAPYTTYGFFSCSHLDVEEIKATLKSAVAAGCKLAIGTRGEKSIFAYDGETMYEQETFPVENVLDALGAGDSFIAGFLVPYLKTRDVQTSLQHAARHAAKVVTIEGSIGVGYDYVE